MCMLLPEAQPLRGSKPIWKKFTFRLFWKAYLNSFCHPKVDLEEKYAFKQDWQEHKRVLPNSPTLLTEAILIVAFLLVTQMLTFIWEPQGVPTTQLLIFVVDLLTPVHLALDTNSQERLVMVHLTEAEVTPVVLYLKVKVQVTFKRPTFLTDLIPPSEHCSYRVSTCTVVG